MVDRTLVLRKLAELEQYFHQIMSYSDKDSYFGISWK